MLYTYAAYLAISLAITIWVGRTLSKNGRLFLVDAFKGREELADSVNHLLLVGFYLVNMGFVTLALQYGRKPNDLVSSVEFLSTKVGMAIVVLGVMHFFNMFALVRFKKASKAQSSGTSGVTDRWREQKQAPWGPAGPADGGAKST
ncbi:MAG: hypothetical protein AAF919_16740 [Pseudomonadota bacterium]